jgi:purine-binding chemotaxis protein CheW
MGESNLSGTVDPESGITESVEVIEFALGGKRYALDIQLVREIVVMLPITPIPRTPATISGVLNLRGEITNIINLNALLGITDQEIRKDQKIIVLVPGAAKGNNVGIIVDNVSSVLQVPETDIEQLHDTTGSAKISAFVKGIIKLKSEDQEKKSTGLLIWIDLEKVIAVLVGR